MARFLDTPDGYLLGLATKSQAFGVFEGAVGLPRSHASLQFHAGYARMYFSDHSTEDRPNFGVGVYQAF